MVQTKKKHGWVLIGFGCGCIVFILILLLGIYLYAGWLEYQESPMAVEVQNPGIQLEDPYQLSSPQEEQLFSHGYPEAFTILFYEEENLAGGIDTVRLETWDYYSQGMGLTFINGELVAEDAIDAQGIGNLDPLPYYPEQFNAFMNLDEVIAAAGIENYIEIPLGKEFLEDGTVYYAYALTFGLKNDELMYIEALALSE